MNLLDLIDKFVELEVRYFNLKDIVDRCEKDMFYEEVEGSMAYSEKDYELEKGYNLAYKENYNRKAEAQKQISIVSRALDNIQKEYDDIVSTLDYATLKDIAKRCKDKSDDIGRKIERLIKEREWANLNSEYFYKQKDYKTEEIYNKISSNDFMEINRLEPYVSIYRSFSIGLFTKAEKINSLNDDNNKHL